MEGDEILDVPKPDFERASGSQMILKKLEYVDSSCIVRTSSLQTRWFSEIQRVFQPTHNAFIIIYLTSDCLLVALRPPTSNTSKTREIRKTSYLAILKLEYPGHLPDAPGTSHLDDDEQKIFVYLSWGYDLCKRYSEYCILILPVLLFYR